ncbi:ribose transport system permease protein [Aurantimicrobium minutum]|uniref:ABC transporter permease n=1 Tax=Aurantimicrobium minutum TaxID=708131 RepID=UPI002473DA0E|nr:ABC transporter permease [Aurantimicrobium minutum]MDH6533273.1 ribose transport system permease protein [Aurantimicrobium minutum]
MTTTETISVGFQNRAGTRSLINFLRNWALPILVVLLFVLSIFLVPKFAELTTIRAIFLQASLIGIAAVGMTALTLSGNMFSLGVTPTVILGAMVYIWVGEGTTSMWLGAAAAIIVVVILGIIQGFIVSLGLNAVIVTLAVGSVIYGVTAIVTKGALVEPSEKVDLAGFATFDIFGIPLPIVVFIVFTALAWFLTEHTLIGRNVHLLGANKETARNSGISPRATTVWAFIAMSLGFGIAAVIASAQIHSVQADQLPNLTLDTVAAVLVGGTAVTGGDGSPIKSAIGALFIATIAQIMVLTSVPDGLKQLILGIVVVALVVILHVLRKAGSR